MAGSQSATDRAATDPLSPEEAFGLLSNERRVGILQALWKGFESGSGEHKLSYSELYARVEYDDSVNFSYHLEKLTRPFVRRTDEGYGLTQSGSNVIRAVAAGMVTRDPAFGPTRVDLACPICDASVEITYADEFMQFTCTAFEGTRPWKHDPGLLFGALTPPVGVEPRPIAEAYRAAVTYSLHELSAFHDGIYPHCASPSDTSIRVSRPRSQRGDPLSHQ